MSLAAMKQALEALEQTKPLYSHHDAKAVLRHAIAEAEKHEVSQEPVAWMFQHDETGRMTYLSNDGFHNPTMFIEMNPRYALVCSLYTHPQPKREWVGLTDEEVEAYEDWADFQVGCGRQTLFDMVRNIEAKLRERNT